MYRSVCCSNDTVLSIENLQGRYIRYTVQLSHQLSLDAELRGLLIISFSLMAAVKKATLHFCIAKIFDKHKRSKSKS